ncbi:MAG: formate dehydrogenase accessory sulfurtransferase FdhD [Opitutaceae bacterium]|nr:formate dehydrogenase accessory sulfurtransferase FdhD [Opitutaceae bacterium]
MKQPSKSFSIQRHSSHPEVEETDDFLAIEEPLEIRIDGKSFAVVMRTPGHDRELAAGFLWSEAIIRSRDDILDMIRCGKEGESPNENVLDIILANPEALDWEKLIRNTFTSSSCGICSKASIDAIHQKFSPVQNNYFQVSRETIYSLPEKLRAKQRMFEQTGGLHASALFDKTGQLNVLREDVGRHNALDKVIGSSFFRNELPLENQILLVSGRVSFELMQKALSCQIPVIVAISAPSSLAVQFAKESGQTLIGFLRGEKMNVYSGHSRISL